MTEELWQRIEQQAVKWGIFPKGGFMNIREIIKEKGRFEGMLLGRKKYLQEGMLAGMQKGKIEGKEEGRQEGKIEGKQEGLRQVIANMFRKNVDIPFIAEVTGLSEKELKKLQKQHSKKQ